MGSLVGRDSGLMDTLPEPMKRRIYGLKHLHSQYLDLESQYKQELRALEERYDRLYEPLFEKRSTIVQGQIEPTDAEVESGRPKDEEGEESEKMSAIGGGESKEAVINADHGFPEDAKGIPHFWLGAMGNMEILQRMITDRDEKLLQHLIDIKSKTMESPSNGFILEFHFSENEFMTDAVLSKSYFLEDDEGDIIFNKAEGSTINWKPQQNLTVQRVTKNAGGGKRGRGGRGKRGRGAPQQKIVVEEPCESFFNFFTPPKAPESDEEVDEEMVMELRAEIEDDFDIGCFIKDRLIKNAVMWYTGEAIEDDDFGFDDEGDDEDDDDEDDDDKDDADDPADPKGAGDEQAPECKQQ